MSTTKKITRAQKKLKLKKETLREISSGQLSQVNGGGGMAINATRYRC